jgi:hypothetical protein
MDENMKAVAQAKSDVIRQHLNTENFSNHEINNQTMLARKIDHALHDAGYTSQYGHDLEQKKFEGDINTHHGHRASLVDLMRKDNIATDVIHKVDKLHGAYMEHLLNEFQEKRLRYLSIESQKAEARLLSDVSINHDLDIKNITPDSHHSETNRFAKFGLGALGLGALGIGIKAAVTHLAPPGIEAILLKIAAEESLAIARDDLQNHRLTSEQYATLVKATDNTLIAASGVSAFPDPTGLSSDKAVQLSDNAMLEAMMKAGVSKSQATQYKLGSMIQVLDDLTRAISDNQSNKNDINQLKNLNHGLVPLTVALGLSASQLAPFGKMSETLTGEALKNEVMRTPDLEKLRNLPPQDLIMLSKLVGAGEDPNVRVNGKHEISIANQAPTLSKDSQTALWQAASYIIKTGDSKWQPPEDTHSAIKLAIGNFTKTYEHLAEDGDLSKKDLTVLMTVYAKLSAHNQINEINNSTVVQDSKSP